MLLTGNDRSADRDAFRRSWKTREEAFYNHWTAGAPANQIQLAFRKHWEVFRELLRDTTGASLEVGCGRGTISSYFAAHGFDCHLLDYSPDVLNVARNAFGKNGHRGTFVCADAHRLPYDDRRFQVVVSIGLLEHFEDVKTLLEEQVRVLAPGGLLLAYVVPERPENVQKHWNWLNRLLHHTVPAEKEGENPAKPAVYRNDLESSSYLAILEKQPVERAGAFGMYPIPMISHSPEFPFSLMPKPFERVLTSIFSTALGARRLLFRRHPWICRESIGQAFLVHARKAS